MESYKKILLTELISSEIDYLNITISKEEILNNDYAGPMNMLAQLISDVHVAAYFRERVDISFTGYEETRSELWEIPEVRNFIDELDSRFPYWLYFLSKNGNGLYVIIKCFLLPFLNPEAEKTINGLRLQNYLEQRGFLAMNHLCELTGVSEDENIQMTNRLVNYLLNNKRN